MKALAHNSILDPAISVPEGQVKRIGVVAHKGKLGPAIEVLKSFAEAHPKVSVFLNHYLKGFANKRLIAKPDAFLASKVDILLSLGGDGTFLAAARLVCGGSIPILGVNFGRLGFLADATLNNLGRILEEILRGEYTLRQRMLLQVEAFHKKKKLFSDFALNEVAFTGVMGQQMIELAVTANGRFLTDYRVDGLLVATPTGSTAYNLSAAGPIVHPSATALLLTPMNPASLSVRPLVLPDYMQLSIENLMGADKILNLHVDGRQRGKLPPGAQVRISRNPIGLRIIRPQGSSYFGSLRSKLGWTGSRDGRTS